MLNKPKNGQYVYHVKHPTKYWKVSWTNYNGTVHLIDEGFNTKYIAKNWYQNWYHVSPEKQVALEKKYGVGYKSSHNYKKSPDRIIAAPVQDIKQLTAQVLNADGLVELKGQKACMGFVRAKVFVLREGDSLGSFPEGYILVTMKTTPEFTHIFRKAVGVLTQTGGILSHAAVVSREYKIPCIVGVPNLLGHLKSEMEVTLDANQGLVLFPPTNEVEFVASEYKNYHNEVVMAQCTWCGDKTHSIEYCPFCFKCTTCDKWVPSNHAHCLKCNQPDHTDDKCTYLWCDTCMEYKEPGHIHENSALTETVNA